MTTIATILLPDVVGGQSYVDGIIRRVCERFGGATLSDARGVWTDKSGQVVADNHTRLEVVTGPWTEQKRQWFIGLCRECADNLGQDSIYLSVVSGTVQLIGRVEGDGHDVDL